MNILEQANEIIYKNVQLHDRTEVVETSLQSQRGQPLRLCCLHCFIK